jgi:hypothetical protein
MNHTRALVGTFLLAAALLPGCHRPPKFSDEGGSGSKGEDALTPALDTLRKGTSTADFRNALQLLNAHAARQGQAAPQLGPEEESSLKKTFDLDDKELAEIRAGGFTPLDAHHVEFCFLLRDVARSFDAQSLPPLERARLGFDWVVRQVALGSKAEELEQPPSFVLRRGYGSARERALIFLALLQQMDIDGAMIACRDNGKVRYWVPGALVEQKDRSGTVVRRDVYLFDTRLAVPVPGPGGKGIATLAQVRSDPDVLKPLTPDPAHPYDVTPELAKTAEVHLVCPLSALAPRMRRLEKVLAETDRVRLAVDPARLTKKFKEVTGAEVGVWAGAADPNSPTRLLRSFLPPEEGGVDRSQRFRQSMEEMVRYRQLLEQLKEVRGTPLGDRLRAFTLARFETFLFAPRDLLLRGRFAEASKLLVSSRDKFREQNEHLLHDPNVKVRVQAWLTRLRDAYVEFTRAQEAAQGPGGRDPEAQRRLALAQARVEALWVDEDVWKAELKNANSALQDAQREVEGGRAADPAAQDELQRAKFRVQQLRQEGANPVNLIVLGLLAQSLGGDSLYLLGLCWQERAERQEARLGRHAGPAADQAEAAREVRSAWETANRWWKVYQFEFPDGTRQAEARLLQARALERLGKVKEAAAALEQLSSLLKGLEKNDPRNSAFWLRSAVLYRLKQLPTK